MAENEIDSLLLSLVEKEIPAGRKALKDSHDNLAGLSDYCKENYANRDNKTEALEQTKAYAAQSLGSVAYQIHSLAMNMLQLMDQQVIQIDKMVSEANNTGLIVDIHKEKVARREIGVLTSSKNFSPSHKIIAPQHPEKPRKYKREEINFNSLDSIGHGVKSSRDTSQRRTSTSSSSGSLKGTSVSSIHSSSQGSLQGGFHQSNQIYQSANTPPVERITGLVRPPVAPVAPYKVKPTTLAPAPPPPTVQSGAPQYEPVIISPFSPSSDIRMPPPPLYMPEPDYDGKSPIPSATSTPRSSCIISTDIIPNVKSSNIPPPPPPLSILPKSPSIPSSIANPPVISSNIPPPPPPPSIVPKPPSIPSSIANPPVKSSNIPPSPPPPSIVPKPPSIPSNIANPPVISSNIPLPPPPPSIVPKPPSIPSSIANLPVISSNIPPPPPPPSIVSKPPSIPSSSANPQVISSNIPPPPPPPPIVSNISSLSPNIPPPPPPPSNISSTSHTTDIAFSKIPIPPPLEEEFLPPPPSDLTDSPPPPVASPTLPNHYATPFDCAIPNFPPPCALQGQDLDQLPPPPDLDEIYQIPSNNTLAEEFPLPPSNFDDMDLMSPNLPPPPPLDFNKPNLPYEEKVIAVYKYNKLRDDELELLEGDIIYVIKKNDDGWFEGIKDGIQGLFPGNHVTTLM